MGKKKIYIQLRQGWFRQIGLTPERKLPCGDCLDFFVSPTSGGCVRCTSWSSYYGGTANPDTGYEPRLLSGEGCDPASGQITVPVQVGKSPTGFVKVWYRRDHFIATSQDQCDFTTIYTDNSYVEDETYAVNTPIGCSNENGGSYTNSITVEQPDTPPFPPPCPTDELYQELRVFQSHHWVCSDFLGYSYNQDGHWSDNGYPNPP